MLVEVIIADPEQPQFVGLDALDSLSPQERARADRYKCPAARQEFVTARYLLRSLLTKKIGNIQPPEWEIIIEDGGRPCIARRQIRNCPNLIFNISHTMGLVAVAISEDCNKLGVDVENVCARGPDLKSVSATFAKPETELLCSCNTEAYNAYFYRLWTVKEAYLKAQGWGLMVSLDSFTVDMGISSQSTLTSLDLDEAEQHQWRLLDLPVTPRHRLGLAFHPLATEARSDRTEKNNKQDPESPKHKVRVARFMSRKNIKEIAVI
jgi:4'-phosphopantetheinyl transferase